MLNFKKTICFLFALLLTGAGLKAQMDIAPQTGNSAKKKVVHNKRLLPLDFAFNLQDSILAYDPALVGNGNAGVIFFNGEFWVSKWATDEIVILDSLGTVDTVITISGFTGTRSFTTDGVSIFAGNATDNIYAINPSTRTLDSTIVLPPSVGSRMTAYDPNADNGNGGFWIANFTSDIQLYSRTGTLLQTIAQATHGVNGIYGGAVDTITPGGPYLALYNQGVVDQARIDYIEIATGTPIGFVYNTQMDLSYTQTANPGPGIAGGLFISDDYNPGHQVIIGVLQGVPDILFGYENLIFNCPQSTNLTANTISGTDVELSWTAGGASTWNIEYGPTGFTPGTGTRITTTSNPYTISGLTINTTYDFYIEDSCSAGQNSFWTGPVSATMGYCLPAPSSVDGNGITNVSLGSINNATSTEPNNYGDYSNLVADLARSTIANLDITFSTGLTYETKVWVDWNQDYDFLDMGELVYTGTSLAVNPTTLSVSFMIPATAPLDTVRMRIGGADISTPTPCYTGSWASYEDYSINILPAPSCIQPTDLDVTNLLANSATLSWTENNITTEWEIEYDTMGFTLGSGIDSLSGNNPITITNLTPNTLYEFYVRSVCGSNDTSVWTGPFQFLTPCTAVSSFPYSENFDGSVVNNVWNCWTVLNFDGGDTWVQNNAFITPTHSTPYAAHGMGNNNDMLISPQFAMPSQPMWLKLWDIVEGSTRNNIYSVLVSTTGKDSVDFTDTLATFDVSNEVWTERIIDLSAYANQTIYIALWQEYSASTAWGFGVDDFLIEQIPSCRKPTDLVVSNLTSTSADLGWTENNSATEWFVEYGTFGFTQGTGTVDTVASNPINITGLAPNTVYEFYVRSVCGRNDSSVWTGPIAFATPCVSVANYPYLQEFNTFVPACWQEADNGTPATSPSDFGASDWYSTVFLNNGSNDDAIGINLWTTGRSDWVISRPFDLSTPGAQPYELRMKVGLTQWASINAGTLGSDDVVQLLISNDGGSTWISLYTWDATNSPSNTGDVITIPLAAYSDTNSIFGIWATEGTVDDPEDNEFFVSNFEIRNTPTCLEPTNISVSNITTSSAILAWTEMNSATVWEFEYGTMGFTQGSGIGDTTSSNPIGLNGLMTNTSYDFYVRSVCTAGDSSFWVGPYSFSTICDTVRGYPYFEDFSIFLPVCWQEASDGTPATGPSAFGGSNWISDNFLNDINKSLGLQINLYFNTRNEWIISKEFDLSSAGPYEVRLEVGVTDWGNTSPAVMGSDDQVFLLISTDAGLTWNNLYTWDVSNQPSNTGTIATIPINSYNGSSNIFAIYATDGSSNDPEDYDFHVDNFEVREIPTCLEPDTLFAANITANTADISWVDHAAATEWEIEYGTFGFSMGSGTSVITTTNPTTISGLSPSSTYEVYVRAICAPGDTSYWSRAYVFPTACGTLLAPIMESFDLNSIPNCWTESAAGGGPWIFGGSVDPDFGSTYAMPDHTNGVPYQYAWVDQSGTDVAVVLETPEIDISALNTPALSFWIVSHNNTASVSVYNKLYVEAFDGTNFVIVDSIQGDFGLQWKNFVYNLTSYVYNTNLVKLRFRMESGGDVDDYDNDMLLDDVEVMEAPSCFPPIGFTAINVTDSSATVDWLEPGLATIWEYEYDTLGFTRSTGIMDTTTIKPFNISGLLSNTTYEFYVRSICGRGDSSAWSGPYTFTTPCVTVDVYPYTQNFTQFTPDCWDIADDGTPLTGPSAFGSTTWLQSDFLNNSAYGDGIRINLYSDFKKDWVISRTFDLSGASQPYELKIDAGVTDWLSTSPDLMGSDDEVQILISTDGGLTWTNLYTWNVSNQPPNTGTTVSIPLSAYTGSDNLFGIWANDGVVNDLEDYDFHITNFSIDFVTSIGETHAQFPNISILPNPSNGIFNIVGSNVMEEVQLSIYNINGKLVYHSDDKLSADFDQKIDISDFSKGLYFVKLQSKSSMEMKKIVIQ